MDSSPYGSPHSDSDDQPAAPTERPRVWTVFLAVFLALIVAILLQAVVAAVLAVRLIAQDVDVQQLAEQLTRQLMQPGIFMLMAAGGQLAFLLAAIVPAWLSPIPFRERLGLFAAQPTSSVYLLAMFGSLVPLAVGIGLAEALSLVVPPDPTARLLFENMTLATSIPFVLFIALAPGLSEELLFRGYVQRRFMRRWNAGWAIGVASGLFAIVHVTPHAVLLAFPIGLWFGMVAWRSGSVIPGMLGHAFINGSVNAWRTVVKFGEVPQNTQTAVLAVTALVGLVCFALTWRILFGGGALNPERAP